MPGCVSRQKTELLPPTTRHPSDKNSLLGEDRLTRQALRVKRRISLNSAPVAVKQKRPPGHAPPGRRQGVWCAVDCAGSGLGTIAIPVPSLVPLKRGQISPGALAVSRALYDPHWLPRQAFTPLREGYNYKSSGRRLLVVIRTPNFSGVVASVNGKDLTFFPAQKQLIKV